MCLYSVFMVCVCLYSVYECCVYVCMYVYGVHVLRMFVV